MTTKHIDDQLWREVEKKTVEAIIETRVAIKETTMLRWLIRKGLKEITEDDYHEMARRK